MGYPSSSALAIPEPTGMDLSYLYPPEEDLALGYTSTDYVPAPKFKKDEVLETVNELQANHSVRIVQAKEYCQFLDTSSPGIFKEDQQAVEDDIMETMPLLGAREDYEFRVGFLATHDPYPRLMNRDLMEHDEAIAVEDLVTFLFACEERQYARRHHADLSLARAHHFLRFGMMVGLDVLDPDDQYCGLAMELLDPLTVFPVFGGPYGLVECYRVYEETNEAIIAAYGGKPGSREYERIRKLVEKSASKTKKGKRTAMVRGEKRCVTEGYSRDEFFVVLDEEVELLRRRHGYREVPITVRVGAFDQPAGVSVGSSTTYGGTPEVFNTNWGDITVSDASMDLSRQLRPFGWRHMEAHRIAEAVAGRRLSIFKWAIDPHKILEFDPATSFKMADEIDLVPGETTKIPLPNKLNLVTPVIDPNVMAGLASDLQANVGGGFLTQMRLGQIPPQTSGSAMGKLQAMGGAGEVTLVRGLEGFLRDRTELRLRLLLNFGDSVGAPVGVVRAPARKGARTPLHAVTPKLLERSGTDVEIELYQWQPDVPLAQYIATLRTPSPLTGKPLISDESAQRKLKFVPDIDREADRINDEALSALPPVAQQRHLARLDKDLSAAMAIGDDDSAAEIMIAMAELDFMHEQQVMSGQAAPPQGPDMGGGQSPMANQLPMATKPLSPALPGNSLPDMGAQVGQEGGAPGQPPPPIGQPTPIGGGTAGGG